MLRGYRIWMLAAAFAVLVLVGCSDDDGSGTTTTAPPTTTTEPPLTTEQVASQIVSARSDYLDEWAQVEEACFLYDQFCLTTAGVLNYMTLDPLTQTLEINFATIHELGEIPDEMADLVDRTENALAQLTDVLPAFINECVAANNSGRACAQRNTDIQFYGSNLATQLEAWEPYI